MASHGFENLQLYRRLDFGSLASLSMLDLRSYRDQQAANGADPSVSSPARTEARQPSMAARGATPIKTVWLSSMALALTSWSGPPLLRVTVNLLIGSLPRSAQRKAGLRKRCRLQ